MKSNAKCFGLLRWYGGFIYLHSPEPVIDLPLAKKKIQFPSDTNIICQGLCSCLEGQHSIFEPWLSQSSSRSKRKESYLKGNRFPVVKLHNDFLNLIFKTIFKLRLLWKQRSEITKPRIFGIRITRNVCFFYKRNRVAVPEKCETKSKGEKLTKASKVQALAYRHTRGVTRLEERQPMLPSRKLRQHLRRGYVSSSANTLQSPDLFLLFDFKKLIKGKLREIWPIIEEDGGWTSSIDVDNRDEDFFFVTKWRRR